MADGRRRRPLLCRRLRDRGGDYVHFVLLTQAEPTIENVDAAIAAGVDEFLCKPVALGELRIRLHAVERMIGLAQQVRQLESFLPICCHCKKIRDDRNYWEQIEAYLGERLGTRFSHGICPQCYEKEYVPQLEAMDRANAERARNPSPPAPPTA